MTAPEASSEAAVALLDAIWDTTDDGMLSLDGTGHITGCNRSAERVFGFADAEIVGRPVTALFPSHLRDESEAMLARIMGGDAVHRFETEMQRKDGMPLPISLSAAPVRGSAGEVVAALLIARDITERQLAQAALAEIEARLREREALARVGGWLWDVRTGAFQWSDEQHRIHGVDPLDFDGTLEAHLACVHDDDRGRVRSAMEHSVASGATFDAEYRIVRQDGEVRWVYARAAPTIGSAGTVVGLRGIGQDITDHRPS
jgi:PAS domain S-box-containing protein